MYGNMFADGSGMPPLAIRWYQFAVDCRQYAMVRARNDPVEEWVEDIDAIWYHLQRRSCGERRYCDSRSKANGTPTWKSSDP